MKKILIISGLILLSAFSFTNKVFAGASANTGGGAEANTTPSPQVISSLQNPLQATSITGIIEKIVDLIIFLGIIAAVFMFVFIGFKFVWAQGDSSALKEARQWFLYAVIGTAILISSKVIVEVIKGTFVSSGVVDESLFKKP